MTSLRAAIDYYHTLLDEQTGHDSQAHLTEQLNRRGLFFGQRPLCTVLRPRLMTAAQYHHLRQVLRVALSAFHKAHTAALADPALRAQFGLLDWEEELIHTDPGFAAPSPTGRMDMFFHEDGQLYLTEYNAETPAAIAYNEVLCEMFYAMPAMAQFEQRYETRILPGRHQLLHILLDAYRQWGGRRKPRIAILDWAEVPTYSEFVLFHDYFERQGFECVIADPRNCEYRHGKLLADGVLDIDIIYKRVLISELIARCGLNHDVVRAVRDRAVCMVNPFRCKMLHKKSSLAVLSDERNQHLFTAEEQRIIAAHIPWTRVVADRQTVFNGQPVDLLTFVADNKDQLVLKPNDDYGGAGIVLGWEATPEQWQAGLRKALAEPYIVQKRIPLPSEPYPSWVDGRVQIFERMQDTAPFIWHGAYASSCLTRVSTVALLNVTAGGGSTVPTFVIEERD